MSRLIHLAANAGARLLPRMDTEEELFSMWPVRYFAQGPIVRVIDGRYTDLAPLPDPAAQTQSPPQHDTASRLDDDVLLLIFQVVLRAALDEFSFTARDPEALPVPEVVSFNLDRVRAPFLIAGVCKSWRTLALRTGSLWTYIAIPSMRFGPANMPAEWQYFIRRAVRLFAIRWCKLLKAQIHRSGNHPLELRVPHFDTRPLGVWLTPREFTLHQRSFRLLAPHVTRIQLLHMAPYGGRVSDVWKLLGGRRVKGGGMLLWAPMLQTLFVQLEGANIANHEQAVQLVAPNLQVCIMPNIKDFRLGPGELYNIGVLQAHCRSIREIIVPAAELIHGPASFPELHHLAISSSTWDRDLSILSETLRNVYLPRLRSACIEDFQKGIFTHHRAVLSTFVQSLRLNANSLERLDIRILSGTITTVHAQLITKGLLFLKRVTILSGTTIDGAFLWEIYRGNEHIRVRLIEVTVLIPEDVGLQGLLTVVTVRGDPLGGARVFVNLPAWRMHGAVGGSIQQVIDDATVCYVEDGPFAWN